MSEGITVVVSPLISLMQDQVQAVRGGLKTVPLPLIRCGRGCNVLVDVSGGYVLLECACVYVTA